MLHIKVKIYTIPILGGEALNEEMNRFIRSKKVLQIESQMVNQDQGAYWSFCIRYIDQKTGFGKKREKVDYKEVLDETTFNRFAKLREIRRQISKEEAIPAFAVFTDEELSGLAKIENLSLENMKKVYGIGEKKIEKYGKHFLSPAIDETS